MERGMDIARINLGHDRQEEWRKMVYNVRSASIELGLSCKIYMDLAGPKIRVKEYASGNSDGEMSRKPPKLFRGDSIRLVRQEAMLSGPVNDEQNTYSVTLEQILNDVRINDLISFDDGKLGGIIRGKSEHHVLVEIIRSPIKGHRLRPEKGINLPMTPLSVPSLTTEDILNLDFVAKNADVVGYSFVRCMKDVEKLIEELDTRKCSKELGIVLKIENNDAFNNLPNLLLTAMQFRGVGVMLARGDLAVELGFEKFSEVQDEIISICEAAHVPVIWATQVLENLAKKGIATRAEVSDVMMAARSECVMLNKGPYINDALDVLLKILKRVRDHRVKGKNRIRELPLANSFFQKINPEEVVSC
jgi:pyruvate kinase